MRIRRISIALILIVLLPAIIISQEFYKVQKLPFNTRAFDELAPVSYLNGLVFISNRRLRVINSHFDSELGVPMYNIWFAELTEDGKWKSPRLFADELSSILHEGPSDFNARGNFIYFTRRLEGHRLEDKTLGIFTAEKFGNRWTRIRPFPFNNPEYSILHPALNADGTKLYFASNMPGGFGGMDIYVSSFEQQQWQQPVNLGAVINTPQDEAFPTYHVSGRLYFSSKGHSSTGGFDIFFSENVNDAWIAPRRLNEPFNSTFDDFSFVAGFDFQGGYFTSNREGSDNIYSFKSLLPQFSVCNEMEPENYCFVFYEETGHVDTTAFKIEWDLGDGTIMRGTEVEHCFKSIGEYHVNLNVIDAITGEFLYREASYILEVKNIEQVVINAPDTVSVNEAVIFDGYKTNLPGMVIDDYYWDFGDGTKAVGGPQTHRFLIPGVFKVSLGVTSNPDARGNVIRKCSYKLITVTAR